MLSKWQCWDFFKSRPEFILDRSKKAYAINVFDTFIERVLLGGFPKNLLYQQKFKILRGDEITLDFLEDMLFGQDLFGENWSYLIYESEKCSKKVQDYILEKDFSLLEDQYLIFVFNKNDSFFKTLGKSHSSIESHQIDSPPFWKYDELVNFLSVHMRIKFSFEMRQFLVANTEPSAENYIQILKNYALESLSSKLQGIELLKSIVGAGHLDQFKLADYIGLKKYRDFYQSLLSFDGEFLKLQLFFSFLQGHFLKIANPSYIAGKARPSKYDNKIQQASKIWNKEEVSIIMNEFSELEILAKKRSDELIFRIRENYLKQL